MAISLQSIVTQRTPREPILVLYGTPGIGKTTFAAQADAPIFIPIEDGLGQIDVPAFPLLSTWEEVIQALESLYDDHDFRSVVIDSLSALEPIIWAEVCRQQGKKSIEDIGYARGYIYALDLWQELLRAIAGLARKGMMPILIAHAMVEKFESPDADAYDRYHIKLHKKAAALLYEQADIIGFANLPARTKSEDNRKSRRALPAGGRTLYLEGQPSMIAKNRYSLPESMPLDWQIFANTLRGENNG